MLRPRREDKLLQIEKQKCPIFGVNCIRVTYFFALLHPHGAGNDLKFQSVLCSPQMVSLQCPERGWSMRGELSLGTVIQLKRVFERIQSRHVKLKLMALLQLINLYLIQVRMSEAGDIQRSFIQVLLKIHLYQYLCILQRKSHCGGYHS